MSTYDINLDLICVEIDLLTISGYALYLLYYLFIIIIQFKLRLFLMIYRFDILPVYEISIISYAVFVWMFFFSWSTKTFCVDLMYMRINIYMSGKFRYKIDVRSMGEHFRTVSSYPSCFKCISRWDMDRHIEL